MFPQGVMGSQPRLGCFSLGVRPGETRCIIRIREIDISLDRRERRLKEPTIRNSPLERNGEGPVRSFLAARWGDDPWRRKWNAEVRIDVKVEEGYPAAPCPSSVPR